MNKEKKLVSSNKGLGPVLRGEGKERLYIFFILFPGSDWIVLAVSLLRLGTWKDRERINANWAEFRLAVLGKAKSGPNSDLLY